MPRDTKIDLGREVAVVLGTVLAIFVQITVAYLCYNSVATQMGWVRFTWGQFFLLSYAIKLTLEDLKAPRGG